MPAQWEQTSKMTWEASINSLISCRVKKQADHYIGECLVANSQSSRTMQDSDLERLQLTIEGHARAILREALDQVQGVVYFIGRRKIYQRALEQSEKKSAPVVAPGRIKLVMTAEDEGDGSRMREVGEATRIFFTKSEASREISDNLEYGVYELKGDWEDISFRDQHGDFRLKRDAIALREVA